MRALNRSGWRNALAALMLLAPGLALPAQYARVALVAVGGAAGGGDYADPLAAIADFGTWCGTPSAANPCLVKVLPGVYDVSGNGYLFMRPFIDVEGSGAGVTTIRGAGSSTFGLVRFGYWNSDLRALSVEATGDNPAVFFANCVGRMSDVDVRAAGPTRAVGILASGGSTNAVLQGVTVRASGAGANIALFTEASAQVLVRDSQLTATGGTNPSAVVNHSQLASGATPVRIVDSILQASGPGNVTTVFNNGGTLSLTNVQVSAEGAGDFVWAAYNAIRSSQWFGTLRIDGSQLSATALGPTTHATPLATWAKCTSLVGATRLDGPKPYTPYENAVVKCAASYNGAYDSVLPNCQW
jgi:hypothetical protein